MVESVHESLPIDIRTVSIAVAVVGRERERETEKEREPRRLLLAMGYTE